MSEMQPGWSNSSAEGASVGTSVHMEPQTVSVEADVEPDVEKVDEPTQVVEEKKAPAKKAAAKKTAAKKG